MATLQRKLANERQKFRSSSVYFKEHGFHLEERSDPLEAASRARGIVIPQRQAYGYTHRGPEDLLRTGIKGGRWDLQDNVSGSSAIP